MYRSVVISAICVVLLGFYSCLNLGINLKYKTPGKAARLPEFTVKDSLIGYNSAPRSCFDVKHYDIHLNLQPASKSISGHVTTVFELVTSSSKIQLDLDAQMIVDSIKQSAITLTYTRKYTAIFIDLVSNNRQQAITVYYHGKPLEAKRAPWEGGFVWKRDKNKNPFAAVACEGSGAKTWLPVKTYIGDEPDSVDMYLSIPKGLVAVSNGNLVSAEENSNGSEKNYHWKTSYKINPYNITFYLADYKLIEEEYTCIDGDKMSLRYYVLPENAEKAKLHFAQTSKILKVYEELFGKYPWPKEGYKLIESPYEGMEHQTAIAYGHGYKNERNQDFDYIILHESAHEWWGNAVSVGDFSDVWIHEGIATYAEALYVEKTRGYAAYLNYIAWTNIMVMNKKPVIGPRGLYYWNYKDGDPYSKGAAMLHTLRNHLQNDALFFSILKTFFENERYKITDTKEFIALVNKMSGKDLSVFFDQYLYHRSSPYLVWIFGTDQIMFRFDRCVAGFTTPVEVEQGEDRFYIYPTTEIQSFKLPYSTSVPVKMNIKKSYIQDGYGKLKP